MATNEIDNLKTTPVLIAGGGPVGLTLAMDLARLGMASVVLETRKDIPPNPRCNTTNARSMELLRRLGCADAVRSAGLPAEHNTDVVYLTNFVGHELTRYRRSTTAEVRLGRQHGVAANWPTPEPQHFISQLYLEPILRRHAVEHWGVELLEGWTFVGFEQDADGVSSVARNVESGQERRFRSTYLVGADGSNSTIRSAIGARLEGVPALGSTCSTFFRSAELAELGRAVPGWMFRFLGGAVLIAIDGGERWLLHVRVPPGEDLATFDPEAAMFEAIGRPFAYEVLGRARWTARAMVSTKFRHDRVFLAGDAAHLWIPMGGFGMNAGIADAISLSWRMAGIHRGWLDPKILDSYEAERSPLGAAVAAQAARWGRELHPIMASTPQEKAELDTDAAARRALGERIRAVNLGEFECPGFQLGYVYENSPVICHDRDGAPPATTLERYVESSWPGARLPHIWRGDGASLYDQLGPGFTLLQIASADGLGPRADALGVAAAQRRVRWKVIEIADWEADDRYDGYPLVLVRPDHHIVWRSMTTPTKAEAEAVIDQITGVSLPEPTVTDWPASELGGGFSFGEGLRWRDDHLVFSDMTGGRVVRADPGTGALDELYPVPAQPNGMAVLPDGRLVVASMFDGRLLVERTAGDVSAGLELYADLSDVVTGHLGDMVADAQGRLYVGDTGARVLQGEAITARLGRVIRVDGPDHHEVVLDQVSFPNGMVISPDGQMLILGLSGEGRVVQCRIRLSDGSLGAARPFCAQLPDGMVGDAQGGVWVCHPGRADVTRYDKAGRATDRVVLPGGKAIACALDPTGAALYVVGIEALPKGTNLFEAMARRETRGVLWKAAVAPR